MGTLQISQWLYCWGGGGGGEGLCYKCTVRRGYIKNGCIVGGRGGGGGGAGLDYKWLYCSGIHYKWLCCEGLH